VHAVKLLISVNFSVVYRDAFLLYSQHGLIFQGGSVGHLHKLLSIESSSQVNRPSVEHRSQE
jgi:hypothetical protein